jgi:hypothetical protein
VSWESPSLGYHVGRHVATDVRDGQSCVFTSSDNAVFGLAYSSSSPTPTPSPSPTPTATPTPLPMVATPAISPSGGIFRKKIFVKLSCATAGATIYYTLDGSDPTTASTVYFAGKKNKGLKLTGVGSHTVKAMAAESGYNNSPITTADFTID